VLGGRVTGGPSFRWLDGVEMEGNARLMELRDAMVKYLDIEQ